MEIKDKIPWAQPEIDVAEMREIQASFDRDWLSMGPNVREFEKTIAEFLKVPHAIAVTNGTVALDIALKILGVGPGDEVIVPAMTYFATASAVSYQHAIPVFADIEPQSYNLDPDKVEAAISRRTKGIIYIDYGGNPADYYRLHEVAKANNLFLLQDAAQSLGGSYKGRPVGAQSEMSTISFHMAKVMTTVEGGMILTHNEKFANEARIRRNQGESGKYLHSHLGTNARMTDICAGIGLAQMKKFGWMIGERRRAAEQYNRAFEGHPSIEVMRCHRPDASNAYFFYPILVKNRDIIAKEMMRRGIDTRIAYPMPVYNQELYHKNSSPCRVTPCPVAETFTQRVLNLPMFPALSEEQINYIALTVMELDEK